MSDEGFEVIMGILVIILIVLLWSSVANHLDTVQSLQERIELLEAKQ